MKKMIAVLAMLFIGATRCAGAAPVEAAAERVNVRDFASLAVDGDWAPAIQAALNSVNAENGYVRGGEIYFPPGDYRVDDTIVVGRNPEHWGLRLVGYGARLIGSATLDAQPREGKYQARLAAYEGRRDFTLALADEKDLGTAIMELYHPPGFEGAGYVVEGLTFDRENPVNGVGILVPAESVPKGTTFRGVKVFNQEYGVFINYAWQFYFSDCIFRHNRVGLYGRSHFNNVGIVNSIFRRNHHHGLQISNRGSWGSNGIHISGSIFESNKGYGILDGSSGEVTIAGCYFEANGNSIGAFGWFTTIDTCHFWGSYGENPTAHSPLEFGWKVNPHSDQAHVVARGNHGLQLRNNRYGGRMGLLLTGPLRTGGRHRLDTLPALAEGAEIEAGFRAAADDGLGYYEYEAAKGAFAYRAFGAAPAPTAVSALPGLPGRAAGARELKHYTCDVCAHVYDEGRGDPEHGVAPGTRFHQLPADWTCPACGNRKDAFFDGQ